MNGLILEYSLIRARATQGYDHFANKTAYSHSKQQKPAYQIFYSWTDADGVQQTQRLQKLPTHRQSQADS